MNTNGFDEAIGDVQFQQQDKRCGNPKMNSEALIGFVTPKFLISVEKYHWLALCRGWSGGGRKRSLEQDFDQELEKELQDGEQDSSKGVLETKKKLV